MGNAVVHFEVGAEDDGLLAAFYGELFGGGLQGLPGGSHTEIDTRGGSVNVVTWQRMCLLLEFPRDRVVLDNIPTSGHVFCADVFANYQTACERGLQPGDRYLAAAVGAGAGPRSRQWSSSTDRASRGGAT